MGWLAHAAWVVSACLSSCQPSTGRVDSAAAGNATVESARPGSAPDRAEPPGRGARELGATPSPAGSPVTTVAAAGSAAAATPASRAAHAGPWNVLLITIDAMRSDMPWNGYARDIAPNLTALARQSVTYTRAYAISSYTAMSVGGFLSGRFPSEMPRSGYFFSAYPDSESMFPELLQAAGVRTMAAHAHFYFAEKAGFHQGFDDYRMVDGLTADNKTDRNVTSGPHLELAIRMLSEPQNTSGAFFAWFHFMDPHDKYVEHPEVPSFGSRARDRYDGEIAYVDQHVGRLLAFVRAQPWHERTAIIVNSDHGEAFGEHGRTRHGFELWEPLVQVPLIVHLPGVEPRRIETPRSMIDLPPTICGLLGVAVPASFQGQTLLPELQSALAPEPREVIVDLPRTSDNDRRRALIWGRYKLLAFGDDFRFELYDLESDPGELRDLRRSQPELYREMLDRYQRRTKRIQDVCPTMRHKLMGKHPSRPC